MNSLNPKPETCIRKWEPLPYRLNRFLALKILGLSGGAAKGCPGMYMGVS